MAAFIAPILSIIDRVIPDRAASAAAKAQLLEMQTKGELDTEMTALQGSVDIIKAEAQSQSWLPRNVRPLLLLLWGLIITLNFSVPIIARFWMPGFQPLQLDPWVFKLTAIGFTGYVGARTWEKVQGKDN